MASIKHSDVISGVVLIEPDVFEDERGLFVETWRKEWIPEQREMVQSNRADRQMGSLVGLHYHLYQSDYWYIPFGTARVVLHDLRKGSPTDKATICITLGLQENGTHNHSGLYIPPGVAHGFAALNDMTITYLVDNYYNPEDELGVAWNDSTIDANWGLENPILSPRDLSNPTREEIDPKLQPRFEEDK
tara:strand:- start:11487 stop:12053 length:567 start_codon:yes stop_codon:yes gene_type:complete